MSMQCVTGSCDISHKTVKELLGLTMLVYEYGNSFKLESNETVEAFLEKCQTHEVELNETCMSVLKDFGESSPMGTVEMFVSDPDTDIQVGITKSDTNKRISVIFRGSESKSDWYYDLMIAKKSIGNDVCVHTGFYHQLHTNGVFESIVKKVNELTANNPDYEVFVTGHSLGAALSTLFGYEYGITTDKKVCVVSFASPRVGNFKFKQEFEARPNLCHYRVSNNRDIITATPMYRYHHCGKNICLYENSMEIKECEQISWWRYTLFYCWSVADHGVKLYYDRLVKNLW